MKILAKSVLMLDSAPCIGGSEEGEIERAETKNARKKRTETVSSNPILSTSEMKCPPH
jgi:hypothetical protein